MMREQSKVTKLAFAEVADPSQSAPISTVQRLQQSVVTARRGDCWRKDHVYD
jgi:hypothetical protein